MTAAEIRAKYPNPGTAIKHFNKPQLVKGDYCILGAACLFIDPLHAHCFPDSAEAARAIGIARGMARRIVFANDRGDFELAWQLLDEALKGRKPCQ